MEKMLLDLLTLLDSAYPKSMNSHQLNAKGISDKIIIYAHNGGLISSWQKVEIQDTISGKLIGNGSTGWDFQVTPAGSKFLGDIKVRKSLEDTKGSKSNTELFSNNVTHVLSHNNLINITFNFVGRKGEITDKRLGIIILITILLIYGIIRYSSGWLTYIIVWGLIVVAVLFGNSK